MMLNFLLLFSCIAIPLASSHAAGLPGKMPLTSTFAEEMVIDELRKFDGGTGLGVVVDTPQLPMGNQEAASTEIVVEDLRFNKATGHFSAVLVGTVGMMPRFQLPLKGRVHSMVNVAVLSRTIGRGEMIAADDLDWIELSPDRLPKATLIDPDHIIGSEARRRLSPGRVLTNRDVGPRRLVRRGQPVRVVYADGGLTLSSLGTARDDGAFGEPIRVMNPDSNLQVQGIATGPSEVTVGNSVMPGAGY